MEPVPRLVRREHRSRDGVATSTEGQAHHERGGNGDVETMGWGHAYDQQNKGEKQITTTNDCGEPGAPR